LGRNCKEADDFRQCSRLAFKKGFHQNLLLVDSDGSRFRVVEVKKIRTVFDFTFRDFLELISANPRWELEVTFGPDTPSRLSVQELKELLSDCFKNNGDFWEEMIDFEEFRDKIAAADSIRQILATFKEFHQLN
jgi:hypothetical protein